LSPSHLVIFWLPYLGACFGHGALLIFAQNWLYGKPLPREVLRAIRKVNLPLILSGPLWLWLLLWAIWPVGAGFDVSGTRGWELLPAGYLVLCWASVGFALLAEIGYWLRRTPVQLVDNHNKTIDVASELGYKPIGQGKHPRLARLPGNEIFRVDFIERTLHLPRLPAEWDGLTVLHLSDLHLCGIPDKLFYQRVLERCREWHPDLVALTGDVVDSDEHHRWVMPLLGRLRGRLGTFAILGNHDLWHGPERTRRRLGRIGYQVLGNSWVRLDVRGRPLTVIGHEGPWFRPAPDLSECPAEGFRLLLSHTPDNLSWARRHGVDLMLAGHNHGGQIRFPLIGSVFVPSCTGRRYDCGTFSRPPTLLHVSRGLGGQHPVRYLCRPEATLLVLRAASPESLPG
jgi:predicted MPP superfamily phosphohydrolase